MRKQTGPKPSTLYSMSTYLRSLRFVALRGPSRPSRVKATYGLSMVALTRHTEQWQMAYMFKPLDRPDRPPSAKGSSMCKAGLSFTVILLAPSKELARDPPSMRHPQPVHSRTAERNLFVGHDLLDPVGQQQLAPKPRPSLPEVIIPTRGPQAIQRVLGRDPGGLSRGLRSLTLKTSPEVHRAFRRYRRRGSHTGPLRLFD